MDLRPNSREDEFRKVVRAFLDKNLPQTLRNTHDSAEQSNREQTLAWQKILNGAGWGAPHWPRTHGGTGWAPWQRLIFDMECAEAGAPFLNAQGFGLLGPVVNEFGTPEQKARFIPPLLAGDHYWAQGFSEPNSGSDLASLQTAARLAGDHYIVNGQKIWTSHAQYADYIFLLVRTSRSERKQEGITFMVAPMNVPGLTIRPIKSIDGLDHLNETFLDNVRIPLADVIGGEGQGWNIAKFLLGNERVFGACDLPGMQRELRRLKITMRDTLFRGRPAIEISTFAERLSAIDMEAEAITMAFLKAISEEEGASVEGWAIGSILKVVVTELHQRIVELMYDVHGDRGAYFYPRPAEETFLPRPPEWLGLSAAKSASEMMFRRASTIYGGTNEIQRELIAKMLYGLS